MLVDIFWGTVADFVIKVRSLNLGCSYQTTPDNHSISDNALLHHGHKARTDSTQTRGSTPITPHYEPVQAFSAPRDVG